MNRKRLIHTNDIKINKLNLFSRFTNAVRNEIEMKSLSFRIHL